MIQSRTYQYQGDNPKKLLQKVRRKKASFSFSFNHKYSNAQAIKLQTPKQFQSSNPSLISKINMFDHSQNNNQQEDRKYKTVDYMNSMFKENKSISFDTNEKNWKFHQQNQAIKAVANANRSFRFRHRKSLTKCQQIDQLFISKKTIETRSKEMKLQFLRNISQQKCRRKERPTKILFKKKFKVEKKLSILSPW